MSGLEEICDGISPLCDACKEITGAMPYTFNVGLPSIIDPENPNKILMCTEFGATVSITKTLTSAIQDVIDDGGCYGACDTNDDCENVKSYYVLFRDKFNKVYSKLITPEYDGSFEIADSDFPGLFNPYAGKFVMWISEDAIGEDRIDLTIDEDVYKCILFEVECP